MSAGTRRRGEKDEIQLQHQALKIDKKSTPYLLKKSLFLWSEVLPILWLHRLLPLESHKESRIYKKDCNG
jgi:hypothetical protein